MPTTNLVLRKKQPLIMTKALKRRRTIGFRYKIAAHIASIGAFVSLALGVVGIVWEAVTPQWVPLATLSLVVGVLGTLGFVIWWCQQYESTKVWTPAERRTQFLWDSYRKNRPHASIEKTRLHELDRAYSRYSVLVEREGTSIALYILRHTPLRFSDNPYLFLGWNTTKTSKGVNREGAFEDGYIGTGKVSDPTLSSVTDAVEKFAERAAELENKAYAEALREHTVDAIATVSQPPPLGARHHAHVDRVAFESEVQTLLASGKLDE